MVDRLSPLKNGASDFLDRRINTDNVRLSHIPIIQYILLQQAIRVNVSPIAIFLLIFSHFCLVFGSGDDIGALWISALLRGQLVCAISNLIRYTSSPQLFPNFPDD